jgi:hypothetical protein
VTPGLTGCAAMSARRGGRVPLSVMTTAVASDPTGGAGTILSWLALWPTVAIVLATPPMLFVAASGGAALVFAIGWVAAGTGIVAGLLLRDP